MKEFMCLVLSCMLIGQANAATVTFTIPDNKLAEVRTAFLTIHPNTETWDDDGDENTPEVPKYTDNQWFKEKMRRIFVLQIQRGAEVIERNAISTPDYDGDVQ